jgi:hypothetical protein
MIIDWGSAPDWFAGLVASAALFYAARAAYAALEGSRLQAVQLRKLEYAEQLRSETEERSQASKVAAWIRMAENGLPVVACFNGSSLPAYSLVVRIAVRNEVEAGAGVFYPVTVRVRTLVCIRKSRAGMPGSGVTVSER